MAPKITYDVLEAQQHCRRKAYFRLCGEVGVKSDFEKLALIARQELRPKAIAKIGRRYTEGELGLEIYLSREGLPFILNAYVEDNYNSIRIDGLKRVDGASTLGDFHYVPVMFSEARRAQKSERQLLAMLAVVLSRVQGAVPTSGILFLGDDCAMTTVRFGATLRAAEDLLRDAERIQRAESPPKLLLNDHCHVCEFHDRCRAQAISEDNLSLLRGLGERQIKKYSRSGLLTLTQLAHTFRPRRHGKRSDLPPRVRNHALHALAIRDKTIYVLGQPKLPTARVRIYLDIEGNPNQDFIYLIGVVVCEGEQVECHSFWANDEEHEEAIFRQFLDVVSRFEAPRIYCYWNYEKSFILRMRRNARRKKHLDAILAAMTNILAIIYVHFYFPTYSNGLKELGRSLGCHWSDPHASGIQSIAWRMRWEATSDECWKTKLIQYNLEDCHALRKVADFLGDASTTGGTEAPLGATPRVAPVTELDKLARTVTWSKFEQPDFDFINKRAYFDYQRSRVFVRTSHALKRFDRNSQRRTWKNRKIRSTRRIEITESKCLYCKSQDIVRVPEKRRPKEVRTRRKRAFDIEVTPGAIKRKVYEIRAVAYRCSCCDRYFVSDRYHRLARHFHGFMSWFAYQQITHRLGGQTLAGLFREAFEIQVRPNDFLDFRNLLARYYRKTYKGLLAKIIAGPVLYIDETEVKLRNGTGYVWVLANTEATFYIFRTSREGDFLRELLKNFTGVLVSDFYAAYDGLDCIQQRCLIHLMRDMNRALLDNPFDQELQSITTSFGSLLRLIVVTVDEHGLKRRHLERHSKAVETFFDELRGHVYGTDASKALQDRLLKNRHRLFTFLHHDGVSWNNNLAENAIKQIGYYREDVGRSIKEIGITEQLVLLSIYQTCRVRGISFLRFLLSREQDIDTFSGNKRPRRRALRIELYPKGYVPPSLTALRKAPRTKTPMGAMAEPVEGASRD